MCCSIFIMFLAFNSLMIKVSKVERIKTGPTYGNKPLMQTGLLPSPYDANYFLPVLGLEALVHTLSDPDIW